MDLDLLSRPDFFAFYTKYMEGVQSKKEDGVVGGNFYFTAKRRVSPTFAGYVDNVCEYLLATSISYFLIGVDSVYNNQPI
jgi:hypothetical protein